MEHGHMVSERDWFSPHPDGKRLHAVVPLNGNGSLEAHKLCATEPVKHILCGRPLPGLILQTVADQVLHVWPRGTPIVLYVIDWTALGGRGRME